jgi:hypothetical protein
MEGVAPFNVKRARLSAKGSFIIFPDAIRLAGKSESEENTHHKFIGCVNVFPPRNAQDFVQTAELRPQVK